MEAYKKRAEQDIAEIKRKSAKFVENYKRKQEAIEFLRRKGMMAQGTVSHMKLVAGRAAHLPKPARDSLVEQSRLPAKAMKKVKRQMLQHIHPTKRTATPRGDMEVRELHFAP